MNELKIEVISKELFTARLLEYLVFDKRDWTTKEILEELLSQGFPKLDFERLDDCLKQMFVYLPTTAVDIGDSKFVWVVSGNRAILVDKNKI